jgi:hypothetical protein
VAVTGHEGFPSANLRLDTEPIYGAELGALQPARGVLLFLLLSVWVLRRASSSAATRATAG